MDRSVIRRLIHGWSANLYGQAVVTVIQLAGVPILLHFWRAQLYGEWLIIFALPFYLSMTDLGFSQSAANDMTARVARHDEAGALTVFQSLCALVFPMAALGVLLTGFAAFLLPLGSWFHFSILATADVRWILWLLAAEMLVKLTEGISHAGFRATGDYALHVTIYYSTLLVQNASVWVVALLGLGPVSIGQRRRTAGTGAQHPRDGAACGKHSRTTRGSHVFYASDPNSLRLSVGFNSQPSS